MYALIYQCTLSLPPTASKDTSEHRQTNVDTDYDIYRTRTGGLCQKVCSAFSSDHSLHRCGQSIVQATTLLLVMQIVF